MRQSRKPENRVGSAKGDSLSRSWTVAVVENEHCYPKAGYFRIGRTGDPDLGWKDHNAFCSRFTARCSLASQKERATTAFFAR
jgi:hypothetical protein